MAVIDSGPPPRERTRLAWLGIGARGMLMGIAELVPGVSGGTIAFVTGIYRQLIRSLVALDHRALGLVLGGRWGEAWRYVDGSFLAALGGGMVVSVLAFAALMHWLLVHHEILVWAFFFGLIVASVVFVGRFVAPWRPARVALGLVGVIAGTVLAASPGLPISDNPLVTFAAGAVAISAWMLPGVSGSFMLLLLGQYQRVIEALATLRLEVLAALAAGCVVGLLLFSRLLAALLRRQYEGTLAFLCGFMAGSLQKLWPWRLIESYYLDADGDAVPIEVRPIGPSKFQEFYGEDPLLAGAVLAALAGLALVVALDLVGRHRES